MQVIVLQQVSDPAQERNWITLYEEYHGAKLKNTSQKYTASLYFAVITVATIGYGVWLLALLLSTCVRLVFHGVLLRSIRFWIHASDIRSVALINQCVWFFLSHHCMARAYDHQHNHYVEPVGLAYYCLFVTPRLS